MKWTEIELENGRSRYELTNSWSINVALWPYSAINFTDWNIEINKPFEFTKKMKFQEKSGDINKVKEKALRLVEKVIMEHAKYLSIRVKSMVEEAEKIAAYNRKQD